MKQTKQTKNMAKQKEIQHFIYIYFVSYSFKIFEKCQQQQKCVFLIYIL